MRRRWAVRIAASVATGVVATALLLSLETTVAAAGATASPAGAGTAGLVVAIALLPATARYPRGVLRRAKRVAFGACLGLGVVGFAGYAGAGALPGPSALLATGATLVAVLPVAYDRGWRVVAEPRTLVVVDDPAAVRSATAAIDPPPAGYCAPPSLRVSRDGDPAAGGPDRPVEPDRSADSDRSRRTPGPGRASRDREAPNAIQDGGTAGGSGGTAGGSGDTAGGSGGTAGGPERDAVVQPNGGVRRSADSGGGHQSSPGPTASGTGSPPAPVDADGSVGSTRQSGSAAPERLGGLSDLDRVVRDRGIDAVVLRFTAANRDGFFCALRTCRDAGVDAFVPRSRSEPVVLADEHRSLQAVERESMDRKSTDWNSMGRKSMVHTSTGRASIDQESVDAGSRKRDSTARRVGSDRSTLAPVALEVLPWHGRLAKRGFDLAFATVGIVACSPLMTAIAIAIRLDSPGPVLYGQWRTGRLGEPFQLLKFRSMVSDAEAASGPRLSDEDAGGVDPRVTRVGRVLRATHLDELPQLFSILVGEMSVVGPRPERPALDAEIAADGVAWRQRWFLRPGLTGLAQINDVTGFQPREKLAHDLEYAARQSLALDVRIVAIQLGQVARDVLALLARRFR